MPDAAWKAWERVLAAIFGGKRRGPMTRGEGGGKTDVIHPKWGIEGKLIGRPSYSDLLNAARQAEDNSEPGQIPVAIVKKKNARSLDALVCMRLETFKKWFLDADVGYRESKG